jgi:cobalamin biosynthesis protein CbiG
LGGQAVLTTSSDVQGLPALDLLGQDEGWVMESRRHLTKASAALVNGDPVGVFQDAGGDAWWPDAAPPNLVRYSSLAALAAARPAAALIIGYHRSAAQDLAAVGAVLVYRPPCLAVGVGCNRGAAAAEIEEAIERTLEEAGLAVGCVARLASIEDKADEAGLLEVARVRGWPLRFFSRAQINAADPPPHPSPWAQQALGVPGVAEPSAVLAAGGGALLASKRKHGNVTVAVALIASPARSA